MTDVASAGIAFVDTETVTREPGHDVIWELGIITRDTEPRGPDREWLFQIRPNLTRADPESLKVCRFDERYEISRGVQALAWTPPTLELGQLAPSRLTYYSLATLVCHLLGNRTVIGAVPNFDTERLSLFIRRHLRTEDHTRDPWHYHLVDVENLAVGYLAGGGESAPMPPWKSDELLAALGLTVPDEERHTALGDCRMARAVWDEIMGT